MNLINNKFNFLLCILLVFLLLPGCGKKGKQYKFSPLVVDGEIIKMSKNEVKFDGDKVIIDGTTLAVSINNISIENDDVFLKKLDIKFWHSMSGKLGDGMDVLIDEFNKNSTKIHVDAQFMGEYNILNQKLIASVAADIPPHISQVFESWTDQLREEGVIIKLDKYIDGPNGFDRNDIVPYLLDNVSVGDGIYSLPCNKSVQALYYNKELFKKAGLDPEKPPKTWDEFIEYGKKLTIDIDGDGKIDQYGLGFATDSWLFMNLVKSFGGNIVNEKGNEALINSEIGIKAGKFMQDLMHKHKIALRCTGREHQNKFAAQDVAMFIGTVVSKVFIEDKLNFPLGMAHLPKGVKAASILSGTNVIIFDKGDTEEIEAAFEFVKWFTDTNQTIRWSRATTYMPVRISALESELAKEFLKKDPNLLVSFTPSEFMDFEPRSAEWFECRTHLGLAVERMIVANEDPKTVLDDTVERMNKVLKNAKYK